eukprot:42090-Eustigmatos_ZCMA.PRE.1
MRGMGKSYLCSQFVRALVDCGAVNRVFLISPTYFTNKHLWDFATVEPDDAYIKMEECVVAVKDVIRKIQVARDVWKYNQD